MSEKPKSFYTYNSDNAPKFIKNLLAEIKDNLIKKIVADIVKTRKDNPGVTYKDQDEGYIVGLEKAIKLIKEEIG